jgi:hypothetical protein
VSGRGLRCCGTAKAEAEAFTRNLVLQCFNVKAVWIAPVLVGATRL